MKKLDVMNMRDSKDTKPGEDLPWQIIDGKVQRVEKKKEIKVEGPIVEEGIKEVMIVEKEIIKKKKKGGKVII